MPRKLRLEMEGGLYHVINRGNYRANVFGTQGAKQAFEKALGEVLDLYGWRLHAYVLMSNHYHLALETPRPNLTDGMHWLQSTFSTRFNRMRKERGHVFQGRYQSLQVEDAAALARVVDYIHLNPVRARLETIPKLGSYPWGSLHRFVGGARLPGQTGDLVMPWRGLKDTTRAWLKETGRLQQLAGDKEEQARLGFEEMSKGWAIGTSGWQKALAKEHAQKSLVGMAKEDARLLREARWGAVLEQGLEKRGIQEHHTRVTLADVVSAPVRLEIAQDLKSAGAPYSWIVERLGFVSVGSLRIRLYRMRNVTM